MSKKLILAVSLTGYILFLVYLYLAPKGFCDSFYIFLCQFSMDSVSGPASFLGLVALFSVITYKAPQKIFVKWQKFILLSTPVFAVLTILISSGLLHSNSGIFNLDADFDRVSFYVLYLIFSLGSLIQIVRGYYQK